VKDLPRAGWLLALLDEVVRQEAAALPEAGQKGRPVARARAYLHRALRESGLVYGTPELPEGAAPGGAPERALFLAILRTLGRLALDAARILEIPPGPRAVQLLRIFAAWAGALDAADEVADRLEQGIPVSGRLAGRIESALARRSLSLSADPLYGLVLHNGASYVDAQLFVHLAVDFWTGRRLGRRPLRRRLGVAARQKALLVEVLTALACAERAPGPEARRAILRQVDDLDLPTRLAATLRSRLRRSFDGPHDLERLVRPVRSREMRRFVVEQTVLASLVEGRRSPKELAFIRGLAAQLGITVETLKQIEAEVAEFYAHHRSVVDVFTVQDNAAALADEVVEGMIGTVDRSLHAVLAEAHQMGELSSLLGRLARGQSLSTAERRRLREQLLDLAKVIPALAIFAAPGGMLLLAALVKVLPQSFLPSAFQDAPPRPAPERTAERPG